MQPTDKKYDLNLTEKLSTSSDRKNSDIWNDFCKELSKLAEPIFRKNRKQWQAEADAIKNINISSGSIKDEIKEAIKKDCGDDDYDLVRSKIYRYLKGAINE